MTDRQHTGALLLGLALLLSACGDAAQPQAQPSRSPAASPSPSPSASPAPAVTPVDWDDPTTTALPGGWTVGPCDGDAPLVCFSRDGAVLGTAEVVSFPADAIPVVREALAKGGSADEALLAHAREHLTSMKDDRLTGCGADYRFVADEPEPLTATGQPAIKTAFTGGSPSGPPTERVVRWVGLRGGSLVSVVLHATDEGACAPGLGGDLSLAHLAELEPVLDRLVESSPLPVGAA